MTRPEPFQAGIVIPFDLVEPNSLGEALEMLDSGTAEVRAASGCTALMLMMKASVLRPSRLVSLRKLAPGMAAIERQGDELRIGALATLAALERSARLQRELPVLAGTAATLANVRVRNQATIGGHLAHADPHMDLPPLLTALGASVVIAGRQGERTLPVEQLIRGYLETALSPAELITQVRIPLEAHRNAAYLKVTSRAADDWPSVGVAVALIISAASIERARIVIGAALDRPTRLEGAASLLRGAAASEGVIAQVADAAAEEARPIGDQHGSAAYKKQLIRVYVGRALRQALGTGAHA